VSAKTLDLVLLQDAQQLGTGDRAAHPLAWLLGIVGTYTMGAFVHVFLVVALVLFVVGLLSGRRSAAWRVDRAFAGIPFSYADVYVSGWLAPPSCL